MTAPEGPVVWRRSADGRQWRHCSCTGEDKIDEAHIPHMRERVPTTPVEVCYFVDETERTILVLCIRTMT